MSRISPAIEAIASLAEALQVAKASPSASFLIHRDGGGWGIVAREALEQIAKSSSAGPEENIPSRGPLPHLYPDQLLSEALRAMGEWPLLPVVNRANLEKLEGVISLEDILRAYRNS